MAIQRMREQTEGWIAKIIVGLIIVVFALFGFGSITTFLAPVPKVATVNGLDVTQQEMEVSVERNRRLLLAQNVAQSEIDEDELRADTLASLINRKLITQYTDELGMNVSDAALDEEIVATEVFQVDGVFDAGQFQQVIASIGYNPVSYREEVRKDKLVRQLSNAVRNSAFVTDQTVERASELANQTRDIATLTVQVESLFDDIEVTDADIESYYEANRRSFMTDEMVDVAYVELKRSDLMDTVEVDENDLLAFFDDTRELYSTKEQRRFAHILIEPGEDEDEQAMIKVDQVYLRVTQGEDFGKLAEEFSDDPGSAQSGGDLGFSPPGTFVDEFEEAGYALANPGDVSEPVRTEFGFHIIKLLEVEEAVVPAFEEVRAQVETEYRKMEAEELFVTRSTRLDELAFEEPDLVGVAEELDLEVKSTGPVPRDTTEGLLANDKVKEAVFSPDVMLDGNNSSIVEITPNHHVVVRLNSHSPASVQPLEDVREEVVQMYKQEEARSIAETRAKEMVAMLQDGDLTRYVADQYGLTWQVSSAVSRYQPDQNREVVRQAFSLPRPAKDDKSVGYTVLDSGDVVVISVTNVKNQPASQMKAQELAGFTRVLSSFNGNTDLQELQESLTQQSDINRL